VKRLVERDAAEWARLEAALRRNAESKTPSPGAKVVAPKTNPELAQAVIREGERLADLKSQLQAVNHELEARATEREGLLKDLAANQIRMEGFPVREQELTSMTRDYENSRASYRSLLDKKLDSEMAAELERRRKAEKFSMLDKAQAPGRRISPSPSLLKLLGCFLGLGLGIVTAFAIELKKSCLIGEWELPVGTPVLGRVCKIEIPVPDGNGSGIEGSRLRPRRNLRLALVSSALLSLLLGVIYFAWKRF
jgi:hypothetical protein